MTKKTTRITETKVRELSQPIWDIKNVVWQKPNVSREERQARNGHRGMVIWFTGLSGAGKSTLAHALERCLFDLGCQTVVLDGDNIRHGLCSDLGFSKEDRRENIRRIGEVAKLFAEAGVIAITAFISPFRSDRELVRGMMPHGDFIEVYVECPIEICEARDVKGFYKRARAGEIPNYTGISSPYEPPERSEITVNSANMSVDDCIEKILSYLSSCGLLNKATL